MWCLLEHWHGADRLVRSSGVRASFHAMLPSKPDWKQTFQPCHLFHAPTACLLLFALSKHSGESETNRTHSPATRSSTWHPLRQHRPPATSQAFRAKSNRTSRLPVFLPRRYIRRRGNLGLVSDRWSSSMRLMRRLCYLLLVGLLLLSRMVVKLAPQHVSSYADAIGINLRCQSTVPSTLRSLRAANQSCQFGADHNCVRTRA